MPISDGNRDALQWALARNRQLTLTMLFGEIAAWRIDPEAMEYREWKRTVANRAERLDELANARRATQLVDELRKGYKANVLADIDIVAIVEQLANIDYFRETSLARIFKKVENRPSSSRVT